MKEEFNLSEKINLIHCDKCGCDKYFCFSQEDVKEFIRLLKESFELGERYTASQIDSKIDKLAGSSLI